LGIKSSGRRADLPLVRPRAAFDRPGPRSPAALGRPGSFLSQIGRARLLLPAGRSLPEAAWWGRHRALLAVLWLHGFALFALAVARGYGFGHSVVDGVVVVAIALLATLTTRARGYSKVSSGLVAVGLLTSSAMVVHLSAGTIEGHFHFFVVMSLLLLYEDWVLFLLAIAYVLLHHGVLGALDPTSVYNHPGAIDHPWRWAAIHALFVAAASAANITAWRLNERLRAGARAAKRRAEESERRFRSAFADAPIGVGFTALDGRWTRVNATLCAMTGRDGAELRDTTFHAITHDGDRAAADEALRRLLAREVATSQLEMRFVRPSGEAVSALVSISLADDTAGSPSHFICQMQDITERKALEEQLRASQKMEAIGQLAGGIAHDFNNLLTAITGHSTLARARVNGDAELARRIEAIRQASDRAASLTEQLLAFSRRQVLQPRIVELNGVVAETEVLLRRLIGEHIEIRTELAPRLPLVEADPNRLAQVVLNLAVNARDAMPGGGVLTIRTVDLGEGSDGQHRVMLAVVDTGCGMPEMVRARAFEPFFTTKEVGKGTGLGLSTVYGIVSQTGGEISVASEVGRGTTFRVYLPATVGVPPEREDAVHENDAGGGERILVVEDEPGVRAIVREVLEDQGYVVEEAAEPLAALELFEEDRAFDLLVSDVVMPGMNGVQLAGRLLERRPGLRVLLMSGYPSHGGVDLASLGAAFLQKPFGTDALVRKVRGVLDQRSAQAPAEPLEVAGSA
jgi:PAS domain S-box-containing protein